MPRRLLIILALTGCADPIAPGDGAIDESRLDVRVRADRSRYEPLDPVIVRITNESDVAIFENLCAGELEGYGFVPGEWNASYGAARICLDDPGVPPEGWGFRRIMPGGSAVDTFFVNSEAYEGKWRVQLDLRDAENDSLPLSLRITQTFRVDP